MVAIFGALDLKPFVVDNVVIAPGNYTNFSSSTLLEDIRVYVCLRMHMCGVGSEASVRLIAALRRDETHK